MAIETTPLGFKKPDGNELLRNGDNVIADNAQRSQELLSEDRARIANLLAVGFSSGFDGGTPFSDFSHSFDGGTPDTVFDPEDVAIDPLGLNDSAVAQALSGGTESPVALLEALEGAIEVSPALGGKVAKGDLVTNVKDYGAVGDGTTDDTTEVRAAITAAPVGGTVYFPAGVYNLTGTLTVSKALTLTGPGVLALTTTSIGVPCIYVTSGAVTVSGLTLEGVGFSGLRVDGSRGIYVQGYSGATLQDVRIVGNTISGFADSGIWTEYTVNSHVAGNTVRDVLYAGIMALTAVDSTFNFNEVSNVVQKAPVVNTYGIALSDLENTVAARSRNCTIIGNVIRDVQDWEGIDTHGGENITVVGNTVHGCARGIAMVSGNPERVAAPTSVTVVGNTVDAGTIPSPVYGIMLAGVDGTTLATGTIDGNTIVGYDAVSPISRTNIDPAKTVIGFNAGAPQRPPISSAYGTLTIGAVTASGGSFTEAVTFPAGRFTSTPVVMVSCDSTRLNVGWASATSSGFTFQAANWTSGNSASDTAGHWVAIQV